MPWIMDDFAASLPDHVRKNLMSRLCRLAAREPLEAAEAYLNLRPYKERADGGFAYVHLRANWEVLDNAADVPDDEELDWVDLKVGEAGDMDVRRNYYERDCEDEPILWAYCYQMSYPKLIERLTHLTLRAMGAQRVPYPCRGCAVRHREHFSEAKSGGLEIVAAIIEYWMRRIGEPTAPTQFSRDSQQFTRLKIPSRCTMPWIMDEFAASLLDDVRKRIMARLCRLAVREPLEAAEAYLNIRPHKERPGIVYTHLRPNWEALDNAADIPDDEELDWVDVKVGEAGDLAVRREYYERDCVDEPILWAYYYQTSYPKLIERLTHLTLRAMGAQRVPYPCHGCAVRHREHSSEAKGGLEVVVGIIEYWMRRIGEEPARIPIRE
ncbi:hypothetical protein B0H13DRAFT_2336006 [Mycena leptocephala]|nr:hypothetical protein B0H13DRAFT_2336006 [Mycena leptocephala]